MSARPWQKFKSKQDGMDRSKKSHLCTACLNSTPTLWKSCPTCGAAETSRQYCMSIAELKRAAELCLAQKTGLIRSLKFQPKFDLVVEGVKICRYVADFQYMENGLTIIEDTKPTGNFMDKTAKFKIDLFNALNAKHGLKVYISRR